MNPRKTAAACSVLALVSAGPTTAHEVRILPADHGNIRLVVGFHVEPAFEDNFNAVDVILSTYDGTCPGVVGSDTAPVLGKPIDVNGTAGAKDPDKVDLKVEAIYLRTAVRPTGPHGSIAPVGIEKRLRITDYSPLAEAFSTAGTYNSWFRPTHPGNATTGGAYGYHVYGTVHAGPNSITCPGTTTAHKLAARTAKIDTYFVCSAAGSLVPPDAFGCVTAAQPFPGQPVDAYVPNQAFGTD